MLRKINCNVLDLTNEEKAWIQTFVLFQNFRTPEASCKINDVTNGLLNEVPQLAKKYGNNIHGFPNNFYFLFKIASESIYIIADLRIDILTAPQDYYFIIGENPVIVLNPILYEKKWPCGKESISSKGAIVLLPISDRKALILYDHEMYRLKKRNGQIVISEDDIELLNYCQFLYSSNCIYTKFSFNQKFNKMNEESKEFRESSKMLADVYKIANPPKKHRQELIIMHSKDLPIEQKFDFLSMTEFSAYYIPGPTMDVQREFVKRYKKEHNIDNENAHYYFHN